MCAQREAGASFHTLRRRLARLGAGSLPSGSTSLEATALVPEPARIVVPVPLERGSAATRRVGRSPRPHFDAFLDGTQASRVLQFVDGIAVIHGTAAAVVRQRIDRRLSTWRYLVERAIYAPQVALPPEYWELLHGTGANLVDTSAAESHDASAGHPFTLRDAAIHRVQQDRERLEQRLSAQWREDASGALLVDGSLGSGWSGDGSLRAVGVVKSHRSLYLEPAEARVIFNLAEGERSRAFVVTSKWQNPVVSWYLRVRAGGSGDPTWGLVRLEVAESGVEDASVSELADEVSSWVMAETAPLSLPDARWDKLMYGVHDCEEFLRAVV
jgi:hypothetical protein